jgi:hypothetical protein
VGTEKVDGRERGSEICIYYISEQFIKSISFEKGSSNPYCL